MSLYCNEASLLHTAVKRRSKVCLRHKFAARESCLPSTTLSLSSSSIENVLGLSERGTREHSERLLYHYHGTRVRTLRTWYVRTYVRCTRVHTTRVQHNLTPKIQQLCTTRVLSSLQSHCVCVRACARVCVCLCCFPLLLLLLRWLCWFLVTSGAFIKRNDPARDLRLCNLETTTPFSSTYSSHEHCPRPLCGWSPPPRRDCHFVGAISFGVRCLCCHWVAVR